MPIILTENKDDLDPGWTLGSNPPSTKLGGLLFWLAGMFAASFLTNC